MDALKIKEAHVLGNSLGAQIATMMAMQAPNRVQSLILIAQNPQVEVRHSVKPRFGIQAD
jgi:pimeloyl-ACP methyl ester carboxylesterase